MSRHRSPVPIVRTPLRSVLRSRDAVENDRARPPSHRSPAATTDAPTTVLDLAALVAERNAARPQHCGPAPRRRRARSAEAAVRNARRHGFAAAGVATAALAVVAPAALQAPAVGSVATQDAALALSTQNSRLPTGPAVAPVVVGTTTTDPATADLFKAGDRVRRQSAQTTAAADQARAKQAAEAGRAERARAEQAAAAEKATRITDCGADSNYGGVADSVQTVGNALECVFPIIREVGGIGSRASASDHPGGYALDLMTPDGDAIADCVANNAQALGVSYTIYDRRIDTGSGWKGMEDRGSDTANHRDHVHVSFDRGADPDVSALRSCT